MVNMALIAKSFKPGEKAILDGQEVTVLRKVSGRSVEIRNQYGFVVTVQVKRLTRK
jgi:hypothetical protein